MLFILRGMWLVKGRCVHSAKSKSKKQKKMWKIQQKNSIKLMKYKHTHTHACTLNFLGSRLHMYVCVCASFHAQIPWGYFLAILLSTKWRNALENKKQQRELVKHNKAKCEIKILSHTHTYTHWQMRLPLCVFANSLCWLNSSQIDICWAAYSFVTRISFTVHELLLFHCVLQWQMYLRRKILNFSNVDIPSFEYGTSMLT